MTAEQIVRDFLNAFEIEGVPSASRYLADKMILISDNPPIRGGKTEFADQGMITQEAMPDYRWGVQKVITQGNQVTVLMQWTGTHIGVFRLSALVPGALDIAPTNRKISGATKFVFTVAGNQISGVHIISSPDEGFNELLEQLGIEL